MTTATAIVTIVQALAPVLLAVVAYALRKVPSQYLADSTKADAEHVVESAVHDLMPVADGWKSAQDGKLTDAQKAQLQADAIAKAENIAQARGYELAKVLQPELVKLAVTKAVEKIKGIQRMPIGTSATLPALLLCVALAFGASCCATYPSGWQSATPENISAVENALAGYLHGSGAPGADAELRNTLGNAVKVYLADRVKGSDKDAAARDAVTVLAHVDIRKLLGVPPGVTDAEIALGALRFALNEAQKQGVS